MVEVKQPTKRLKEICAQFNEKSNNYSIKVIDLENCLYRKLENGFDFEVSGLDRNSEKIKATVYVWKTVGGTQTVETISDINSTEHLFETLEALAAKYSSVDPASITWA